MKPGPSSVSRDEPVLSHGRLFFPSEGEVGINNGPIKAIHSSAKRSDLTVFSMRRVRTPESPGCPSL